MTQQQSVLAWLKDAHAMEQGGTLTLENHAAAAQDYPEVQSKLRAHAEATRHHADLVKGCIERLGGRPSALKEAIGTVMGKVQGVANLPTQDVVVKNALGDLAAENFEIASYRSLIAAAEQAGDGETANVCRQILDDEEEMASWLAAQIPVITRQFLAEQTGAESPGVQAQVMDKAKQTVKGFSEQGKELAEKAKQTGQGVQARVADKAKQLTKGLEEQGEELAEKAKQKGKDALVMSGALLVGAGVGLLVVQALRSGSDETRRAPDQDDDSDATKDAYNAMRVGHDAAYGNEVSEVPSVESVLGLDLRSETLDLGEPFMQNAELSTGVETQSEDLLSEMPSENADPPVISGLQSQQQNMDDSLSSDADLREAELMNSDAQSDVRDVGALAYTEVWLVPGPYSGLGPIGYDNSGNSTGQEVYSRLTQHGQVDASNIEITIDNGEVLLEGTVNSEETKRLAEEAVETVTGVSGVQNLLQVQASQGQDS